MNHWYLLVLVGLAVLVLVVKSRRGHPAEPDHGVSVDDEGIRRDVGGIHEAVRWADLERIVIVTNDEGPMQDDVFWLFIGRDDRGCAVPGQAVDSAVMDRLGALPGVDYGAVIAAMGSVDNASFEVWKRAA